MPHNIEAIKYQTACLMNKYLANLHVLNLKIRNYHWNVVGRNFFDFHKKLDELYETLGEEIDLYAERILMLGYKPVASLRNALVMSCIREANSVNHSAPCIARDLICDFEMLNEQVRHIAKIAGEINDEYTTTLIGDSMGFYEKNIWMFRAYLTS
ncbi:DNA starvation/stationary phase protection protein [Clostridiaceae bacterium M8S5]|nr:DNA starvation/stationary phase protection protein [Clostridiaceae bacterium M8S5]